MLFEKRTNLLFLLREHINMVFLLREIVCVLIARTIEKKNCFFLLHELVNDLTAGNLKKNLFTARTHELLLRELNQKKKFILLHELVCVIMNRAQEKKNIYISFYCTNSCVVIARTHPKKKFSFYCTNLCKVAWSELRKKKNLLHELDKKLVRNYYRICEGKQMTFCIMRTTKKRHVTARIRWNCVVFILRELEFFSNITNCIQSLSNSYSAYQLQTSKKKNPFWLCQQSKQNCLYCTN